jgi:superfamily II DNA/RNA helicase
VLHVLKSRSINQALIFVNSKIGCARLARTFERDGLKTQALHGDKSQDERLKALEAFKGGTIEVMVATDVAARGLDIVDLPAVFNFDVPFNAEDYVHRIGRTGRAGQSGLAVTLVSREDARLVGEIEKLLKKKIELEPLELDEGAPPRRDVRERVRRDEAPVDRGRDAVRDTPREPAREREREPQAFRPRPAPSVSTDPFFDRPYESAAPEGAEAPSWERKGAAQPTSRLSPNIKSKKRVAALFGAKVAADQDAPEESERAARPAVVGQD